MSWNEFAEWSLHYVFGPLALAATFALFVALGWRAGSAVFRFSESVTFAMWKLWLKHAVIRLRSR